MKCSPCSSGHYQSRIGQALCVPCEMGMHCNSSYLEIPSGEIVVVSFRPFFVSSESVITVHGSGFKANASCEAHYECGPHGSMSFRACFASSSESLQATLQSESVKPHGCAVIIKFSNYGSSRIIQNGFVIAPAPSISGSIVPNFVFPNRFITISGMYFPPGGNCSATYGSLMTEVFFTSCQLVSHSKFRVFLGSNSPIIDGDLRIRVRFENYGNVQSEFSASSFSIQNPPVLTGPVSPHTVVRSDIVTVFGSNFPSSRECTATYGPSGEGSLFQSCSSVSSSTFCVKLGIDAVVASDLKMIVTFANYSASSTSTFVFSIAEEPIFSNRMSQSLALPGGLLTITGTAFPFLKTSCNASYGKEHAALSSFVACEILSSSLLTLRLGKNASNAMGQRFFISFGGYSRLFSGSSTFNIACGPGTYSVGPHCVECPAGTFNPSMGAADVSFCLPCPAGHFCLQGCDSEFGSGICSAGSFSLKGLGRSASCSLCPAGKFCLQGCSSEFGDGICSSGSYSIAGSGRDKNCEMCPPGSACEAGCQSPVLCPPGSFSGAGYDKCTPCEINTFAFSSGLSACELCNVSAGNYSWRGASQCELMEHNPILIDFNPNIPPPEPCAALIMCCALGESEADFTQGGCQGCDCSKITGESPRRPKSLDDVSVNRWVHASSHAASTTFILFSLSASSRQVVFIASESASFTVSERISKLRELAKNGMLDKSIMQIKIGSERYVTHQVKSVFLRDTCRLCCSLCCRKMLWKQTLGMR
jgi:hypothetical protein